MATKTYEIVLSDLSKQEGASRVVFGIDRDWYEIDLTPKELAELTRALEKWRKAGRRTDVIDNKYRRNVLVPETTAKERELIREWAKKNGHELADRGRIPMPVVEAYQKANKVKFELRDSRAS